jgi:beta-phosphoglucomutase-like phosphatase (HAD superfamily)
MNTLTNIDPCSPEYVFFDMDGTLIETDFANLLAYKKAISIVLRRKNTITYNPACRFDKNMLREQIQGLSDFQYRRIAQIKNELNSEFLQATYVNEYVVNQLVELSQKKSIYLVTNAAATRAEMTISFHGLESYFSSIICKDDRPTNANKYLHAVEHLCASPKKIVVFENEKKEIINAAKAGINPTNIYHI